MRNLFFRGRSHHSESGFPRYRGAGKVRLLISAGVMCLAFFAATPLFARGTPEDAWEPVDGTEHWRHDLDLSDLEPGNYNLIIRGLDAAGNEALEGPVDLRINPALFVPSSTIIYPEPDQTFRSDFSVVGATSHRGTTERVEIRIDEGEWRTAEGTEYWSARIPVDSLEDGRYTVEARAFDAGGAVGPVAGSTFRVDREQPHIEMESHETGAIVAGRTRFEGFIEDAHEITSVRLRRGDQAEGPEDWEDLRIRYDRSEERETFRFDVRTEDLADGPHIYEIRAENETGLSATLPFLFLVNNEPPVLDLLSPEPEAAAAGDVVVVGSARDEVGIARLWYEWDGEQVDVPLEAGNPYFSFSVDTRDAGRRSVSIPVFVEDEVGNRTDRTLTLANGRAASEPGVRLLPGTAEDRATVAYGSALVGSLSGSAPGDELIIEGDVQGEVIVDAYPGFAVELSTLLSDDVPETAAGSLDLRLTGRRADGLRGATERVRLSVRGNAPSIAMRDITTGPDREPEAFAPGIGVAGDFDSEVTGRVLVPSGLSEMAVTVDLPDGSTIEPRVRTSGGEEPGTVDFRFSLETPQPPDEETPAPSGIADIRLRVSDEFGETAESRTFVYVGEPDTASRTELRFADLSETVILGTGDTRSGLLVGESVRSVGFAGDNVPATVSHSGSEITVTASEEGSADGVVVVVEGADGREYRSDAFDLVVSDGSPEISLDAPLPRHVSGPVEVRGRVDAPVSDGIYGERSLTVRLEQDLPGGNGTGGAGASDAGDSAGGNGEPSTREEIQLQVDEQGSFSFSVDPGAYVEPGVFHVTFAVTDRAGRTGRSHESLLFDPDAPELNLISPAAGDVVVGRAGVAVAVDSRSPVESVEWSTDGEQWEEIASEPSAVPPSPGQEGPGEGAWSEPSHRHIATVPVDFAALEESGQQLRVRARNEAGNEAAFEPDVTVDREAGRPVVDLQLPRENRLVEDDLVVSGFVFDEAGVDSLYWRIVSDADESGDADTSGEAGTDAAASEGFTRVAADRSFRFQVPMSQLADNEQTLELYAENINGVTGEVVSRGIRVSSELPSLSYDVPEITFTGRDTVLLEGTATDANGIGSVMVSFDSGSSFVEADFTEVTEAGAESSGPEAEEPSEAAESSGDAESNEDAESSAPEAEDSNEAAESAGPEPAEPSEAATEYEWRYELDSRLFADGTVPVHVKAEDRFGVEGFAFGIVNVDNTAPVLSIVAPRNGDEITDSLPVRGRVDDTAGAASLQVRVRALAEELADAEREPLQVDLPSDEVIQHEVDVSDLPAGRYNVQITATDSAGNSRVESKNINIVSSASIRPPQLILPADGRSFVGSVEVQGRAGGAGGALQVYVDGSFVTAAAVDEWGNFQAELDGDQLSRGANTLQVIAEREDGVAGESDERTIYFSETGPRVRILSHEFAQFVSERPWIEGSAEFIAEAGGGDGSDEDGAEVPRVSAVHVSLDNGATFERARGREEWRYRLETQNFGDGPVSFLVRAEFDDGSRAVARTRLNVDTTGPSVSLRSPGDGEILGESLEVIGTAEDENELGRIELALRPGRSSGYDVPEFIQGMYLDVHTLGLTYADVGLGLSFFDDNVRLQVQAGTTPEEGRFSGQVFGGKILANVASVPFSSFLGPDFEFLSLNAAVGANFSYINLNSPIPDSDVSGVVLSAIVGQLEFPRFELSDARFFNSYSLYTEPQLWFVPSDVDPAIEARLTFGMRVGLF